MKRFLQNSLASGLALIMLVSLGLGGYGYLMITSPRRAILYKINVQNFLGYRDVTDELLWFTFDELARLQNDFVNIRTLNPQTCGLTRNSDKCLEYYVSKVVTHRELSSLGLMVVATKSLSAVINSEDGESLFGKTKLIVGTIRNISSALKHTDGIVSAAISSKFGALNAQQTESLSLAMQDPLHVFRRKLESFGGKPDIRRLPSKEP